MTLLIAHEIDELSYALGIKSSVQLQLAPVAMPNIGALNQLDYRKFEARAIAVSPERKQYDYLLGTLEYIKEEINFSFFGASPFSRGVAGGVFDAIPATSGIFSRNATMKIVDAQGEILRIQRTGIEETVKRQLRAVTAQFNSDLLNYNMYGEKVDLAKASNEALLRRSAMGDGLNAIEFSDNVRIRIQAETAMLAMHYRLFSGMDRLDRINYTGDYAK